MFKLSSKRSFLKKSTKLQGVMDIPDIKTSTQVVHIRITCPYDLYPLIPHFYIVKQGYTFFLIFALKHRSWVLVRTASLRRF